MLADKRIIKTRSEIKNAFMQLIIEKEPNKISVSALTEKAQVNRTTFYLHYRNIDDVILDIESEISAHISASISNLDFNDVYGSTCTVFSVLTDALNENIAMKNYILNSTSSKSIISRLKEILADKIKTAVIKKIPERTDRKTDYSLTFIAAGIIDTYVKWANSEDKTVTLGELIETVSTLIQKTVI